MVLKKDFFSKDKSQVIYSRIKLDSFDITYISENVEHIWGYKQEELVNKIKLSDLILDEDLPKFKEEIEQKYEDAWFELTPFNLKSKNNETKLIKAIFINEINSSETYCIFIDISLQKQIIERLYNQNNEYLELYEQYKKQNEKLKRIKEQAEYNEKKYKLLFENSPLGTYIAKPDGTILEVNNATLSMLNSPSAEATKKINVLSFPPLKANGYAEKFKTCVDTGEIQKIEIKYKSKWGKETFFSSYLIPLKDQNGNVDIVYTISEDVTKEKQIQEELIKAKEKAEQSDKLKTEFIHNMSHEIRTPMNGILGFSQILERYDLSDDERKQYIKIIQNSGKQLLRVIDDILEISRLETKQVETIEKEVNLNNLLLDLFSIFDLKAKEKEISLYLRKSLTNEESIILTDASKLNKILSNLLENAIKFTNKGFVELGYNLKNDKLEIYVKDTGIGIKPENQEIIFERFSQEEKQLSQKVGGLGLGLSIAKENTQLLGGEIKLESEKGKGTTFYIIIPYKPVYTTIDAISVKNKHNKYYNILIVEDEEVNYLYLEVLLNNHYSNINIIHAINGKEAVNIFKNNKDIDLILMDIKMPVLSGLDATKIIRQVDKTIPIIAQTAYSTYEEIEKVLNVGCNSLISKPISEKDLNRVLNKYLFNKTDTIQKSV